MNSLLNANCLMKQKTVINSIWLASSMAYSALAFKLPKAASTSPSLKHLKSIDLIPDSSKAFHSITRPSPVVKLFKDFVLHHTHGRFNYSSKIQPDQDKDKEEEAKDIPQEKDNENEKRRSPPLSLEDFNAIKTELDLQMKKTDELNQKFNQLRKAYLDNLSENKLIKQRHERELKVIKEYAIGKFAKDLVDVHDNFLRALDLVKDMNSLEAIEQKEELFKSFLEGIKMVKGSLSKAFIKHGIIEYTPKIKDKFNPNYHEALYDYEDPLLEPGSIGKVMCSGFMLGNRIIRPAKVGVIKKKTA